MINRRGIALIAALSGLLAVVLAAAGAHIIPQDNAGAQQLWATALQMHLFHTVALLGVAALIQPGSSALAPWSGILMAAGILLFSGSLYLRAGGFAPVPGVVTPIGGMLLMAAWVALIIGMIRQP
jgi:uncharacterized membrane protein YgdD (TMEM256/DUF423 family)